MHYTWTIANRYLRSKRRTGFISLITYLSAAGVAVGAAALVIVLSIMNGFEDEVRSRILGADAYLRVSTFHERGAENWRPVADSIAAMEDVVAVTPYVLDKGMIRHRRRSEGCVVRGIDPATVGRVNELPNMLVAGSLDSLDAPGGSGALPGAILGRYLADELVASPGDTVLLFAPGGMLGPFAAPRVSRLRVAGIFESGLAEFDQVFVLTSLREAQELFGLGGRISGLDVRTRRLEDAAAVKQLINDEIGYPWYPRTWFEMRKTLYNWMQLEKWAMFIILSLIILVAAFNIISTLVMVTLEKRKEIGILMAMGATRADVARIFLLQGFAVGVVGVGFGIGFGYVLLRLQQVYGFFHMPSDIYILDTLPVVMRPLDFTAVGLIGLALCLLASVYPARRAAELDPVEAIRYE